MLKTDLYSDIKSEDSQALDSGTSQLGSQRGFGGIEKVANLPHTRLLTSTLAPVHVNFLQQLLTCILPGRPRLNVLLLLLVILSERTIVCARQAQRA